MALPVPEDRVLGAAVRSGTARPARRASMPRPSAWAATTSRGGGRFHLGKAGTLAGGRPARRCSRGRSASRGRQARGKPLSARAFRPTVAACEGNPLFLYTAGTRAPPGGCLESRVRVIMFKGTGNVLRAVRQPQTGTRGPHRDPPGLPEGDGI